MIAALNKPFYLKANETINEKPYPLESSNILKSEKSLFAFKEMFKHLSLQEAVSQGLLNNQSEKIRSNMEDILDINYADQRDKFWWPEIKIKAETNPQRIGTLSIGQNNSTRPDKFPKGSLGLTIENYTLFNWGKDYLDFLNIKEDYKRNKEDLKVKRNQLEKDIITTYFNLLTLKKLAKISKKGLRFSSFIYRLNRERLNFKKITEQEFLESRSHYLELQELFQESFHKARSFNNNLASLLGDQPGTVYVLKSDLVFKKIDTPLQVALELSLESNPELRKARSTLANSQRDYEKSFRDNLPLPKISINLGSYHYFFGKKESVMKFETESGNSNIDLVATLNASWSLLGEGGFFNQRTLEKKSLNQSIAYQELKQQKKSLKRNLSQSYERLLFLQKMIPLLKAQVKNCDKTFGETLENYRQSKTQLIQFKKSLDRLLSTQKKLELYLNEHLQRKFNLASLIGVPFIPGENISLLSKNKGEE
tara:strand:+ start:3119 stop:4561 length:1443 start_codon:yes stop_codon:yes gene_type:complete